MMPPIRMEPVETWTQIFARAKAADDKEALTRILKNAAGYLRNVAEDEKEEALEIIFEDKGGLLKFIETILSLKKVQQFDIPLKESLRTLQFLMEFYKQEYEPYAMQTKDLCICCINQSYSFETKKEAAETLKKLIQLFKNFDLKLDEIVENYTEGSVLYCVLGTIGKHCPETKSIANLADAIYLKLLYDLQHECKLPGRKQNKEKIQIYLECLSDLIVNFVPFQSYSDSDYFIKLYRFLSLLSEADQQLEIRNNSICILSTHMHHFSSLIFKDYEKWLHLLNNMDNSSLNCIIIDALKAFYKIISLQLSQEHKEDIFLYFKNYFMMNLTNTNLSCTKKGLILFGLGELSLAYPKHSPSEISEIFQMVAHQTTPLFAMKGYADRDIETLPYYLQALSKILQQVPSVSLYHLDIIIKLSKLIFEMFPKLREENQRNAIEAIKLTFVKVMQLEKNYRRQYFYSLFYEGISWTCTHTTLVDLELQQEFEGSTMQQISYTNYKSYLSLWHSILKSDEAQEDLNQNIFNELVLVLILIISELNLSANKEEDFGYFVNLVELFEEIFAELEVVLLQNQGEKLLTYFIKCSYKYTMVSGFYKLVDAVLKKLDFFSDHKKYFGKSTNELISQYLLDVIKVTPGFSNELQISCIYLIFNAPLPLIADMVDETIIIFKIAFKIGLNDLSLAFCALETLESWKNKLKNETLNCFYEKIIFLLEPYFTNTENLEDIYQDMTKSRVGEIKSSIVSKYGLSLELFQKKVLLLYCSLDINILLNYTCEKFLKTNALWARKHFLPFVMNYSDLHFELHFINYLPRIIKLIEGGDRRTAFSACEFLHTVITIILGKKLLGQCFEQNLFSTILKLGCDTDDAMRNLYHPLIMQLIHYLSSKVMVDSEISKRFVNLLFDNLKDESDPLLRDYCGVCLKEFIEWTLQSIQSSDNDPLKFSNFSSLVNRIINFAHYPSNTKRLAAARAFNYLYTILSGSRSVINTYWIVFLYAFIKALEKCSSMEIISAVINIEGVIKGNANILNAKSQHRIKPSEFSNETLKSAVIWLFKQCGSTSAQCRHKCMKLFENLCPLIPGYKSVEEFVISCCVDDVNKIALKNVEKNFENITVANTKAFLKSLDFYIWIFNSKYISPNSVLVNEKEEGESNSFFQFFTKFVSIIVNQKIETTAKISTKTFHEAAELIALINKVILKIIHFTRSVLNAKEEDSPDILKYFWTSDLYLLINRFILSPREIGLIPKTLQTIESRNTENVIIEMMHKLPPTYFKQLQDNLFIEKTEDIIDFVNINDVINLKKDVTALKDFVRGITMLRRREFFDFEEKLEINILHIKEKITIIFEALKVVVINGDLHKKVNTHIIDYLEDVMTFLLVEYKPEIIETIVNLILSKPCSNAANGTAIAHQEYFYETFRAPILRCMLINPIGTLDKLDKTFPESPEKNLALIEDLLTFVQCNCSQNSDSSCPRDDLVGEVINKFSTYIKHVSDDVRTQDRFLNVYRLAVAKKKEPTNLTSKDALYCWILEELGRAENLARKTTLLQSFLMCLIEEPNGDNPDLFHVLESLRDKDALAWRNKLAEDEAERSQAMQCLQALLDKLVITKSRLILKGVTSFAAGACEFFSKELIEESLRGYFNLTSKPKDPTSRQEAVESVKSLDMLYHSFEDMSLNSQERLDILNCFLLPAIECCSNPVIVNFYELNARDLANYVDWDLADNEDRQQDLISRIGCYKLFEIMYGRMQIIPINFPLRLDDNLLDDSESLKRFLIMRALEVRSICAESPEEKNLVRLLHCAAFNCCVAMGSLGGTEEFYEALFREAERRLIWEQIIDCDRVYAFPDVSSMHFIKKTINIRTPFFTYLMGSSDATEVNAEAAAADRRLRLSLEQDELNEHECMATITGTIVHLFNCEVARLPRIGQEVSEHDMPKCLARLREALGINKDNIILFLLRVICNVKRAFVSYLRCVFEAIVSAVRLYLNRNPLNYLIRDTLVILIETHYNLRTETEAELAQSLIEILIERAPNEDEEVYEYNVELIESLIALWRNKLKVPTNLGEKTLSHPELAMKLVVMLFRHKVDCGNLIAIKEIHRLVRRAIFRWQEPITPKAFEALGWIMQNITEEQRDSLVKEDLIDLFFSIKSSKYGTYACTRLAYQTFVGWPGLACCSELHCYVNPLEVEHAERKAECYNILLRALTDSSDVETLLTDISPALSELNKLLNDRVLPCINIGFNIISELLNLLDAVKLLPYLKTVERYAKKDALLKHKKVAFGIFMDAFEKHSKEKTEHSEPLLELCQQVLINGITDPNDEIQDELLDFWKERGGLPEITMDRMMHLLKLYVPSVHASFAQFFCTLMLDLTAKSPNNQKTLFAPLSSSSFCSFEEYEVVAAPRRHRKRGRRSPPLFATTIASLLERSVLQQGSRIRRKNEPYEPGASVNAFDYLERYTRPKATVSNNRIPDPSENKLSKRFPPCAIKSSKLTFLQPISDSMFIDEYYQKLKEESAVQKDSVRINRRYRVGSYPDVEISQPAVVITLDDLVRRDQHIASDLAVSIICALAQNFKNTETYSELEGTIMEMCEKAMEQPNDFAPVAMKIVHFLDVQFNVDNVSRVAKSMSLQSLGILLLEEVSNRQHKSINSGQSSEKLIRHRLQLASLYRSCDESDLVSSIFENWTRPSEPLCLQRACLAEEQNDWLSAKIDFEEAYETSAGSVKNYSLDGLFRCLSELSSWTEINNRIETLLNNDYTSVLQNPRKYELLPWIFTSQLQKMLEDIASGKDTTASRFLSHINTCKLDETASSCIQPFGEELAAFRLFSEQSTSRRDLRSCLDYERKRWIQEPRLEILEKLGRVNEVDTMIGTLKCKDLLSGSKELMDYWEADPLRGAEKLMSLNLRAGYRLAFGSLLIERLKDESMDSGLLMDLMSAKLYQRLKINELAIEQRNKIVARKHSLQVKNLDQTTENALKLKQRFNIIISRYQFLCSELEKDPQSKIIYCSDSWKLATDLMTDESVDPITKLKVKRHLFDLSSTIYNLLLNNIEYVQLALSDEFISENLNAKTPEQIEESLFDYSYNMLKNIYQEGNSQEIINNYDKFVEYCFKLISDRYNRSPSLKEQFISAVSIALRLGSVKAIRYFSCFLKPSFYKNIEEALQLFINQFQNVPSWMFLPWKEQITLSLMTSIAPFVLSIFERLIKEYPNGMIYSTRMVYKSDSKLQENPTINAAYKSLFANPRIELFLNAIEYLCQPEHYLKHHLLELVQSTSNCETFIDTLDSLLNKTFMSYDGHEMNLKGPIFKEIFDKHYNNLERLKTLTDYETIRSQVKNICTDLCDSMHTRLQNDKSLELLQLHQYSPYLNDFMTDDVEIEVPGQYNNLKKPSLQYHAKIAKFDSAVEIVTYKSCFMKISMIGTNAKSYEFLVKLGTDVRRDQRMQQIFEIANETLRNDTQCRKRHLRINTYNVIPLSSYLGLVQWVNETKTLKEYIEFSMTNKSILQTATTNYQEWIEGASTDPSVPKSCVYKQALVKYSTKDVVAKMDELTAYIDSDTLRKTFIEISPSSDCFYKLRQNFIKSYSTMCIIHWLTGVGDRYLENTLVEVQTGRSFGVDFGLVFGAGIEQPIPELIPIRLTAQILGLLRPFGERDLFGATMCRVLSALRNETSFILGCLDVFLREPIDWNQGLNERLREENEYHKGVRWLPKRKLATVEKKLIGAKPSSIMLDELLNICDDENEDESMFFTFYKHVINGCESRDTAARSSMNHDELTAETQIQCLLDQATDVNALGRMCVKWLPFV